MGADSDQLGSGSSGNWHNVLDLVDEPVGYRQGFECIGIEMGRPAFCAACVTLLVLRR